MGYIVHDRVKETTTTTGVGDIELLGAVTQFQSFSNRADFLSGVPFDYVIAGQSGAEWETGRGHLRNATTLVRDAVAESSNDDALVNFSAGIKDVFCTLIAESVNQLPTLGEALAMFNGLDAP